LTELGITTIGELRTYDGVWLARLFGERAEELQALARGEDFRQVEVERIPKSYGEENTFEEDIRDRDTVSAALTAHSEAVARRIRHDGFVARTVSIKVKLAERREGVVAERAAQRLYPLITRRRTLAEPT